MYRRILILALGALTCGPAAAAPPKLNQSDPVKVTELIFAAARARDVSTLRGLCDPLGKNDGDTRRICTLDEEKSRGEPGQKRFKEFVLWFEKGRISGKATIHGDSAAVPFLFGPDGKKPETMNLIRRNGRWYLFSF